MYIEVKLDKTPKGQMINLNANYLVGDLISLGDWLMSEIVDV